MLGNLSGNCEHNWAEAERWYGLAMGHRTVPWHVREWYAWFYLLPLGRAEEACRQTELALVDNPLSQIVYCCLGACLIGCGREAEAVAAFERMIQLDPQFWVGLWIFGMLQALRAKLGDAHRLAGQAMAANPRAAYTRGLMAGVLRAEGKTAEAQALLDELPSAVSETCARLVSGARNEAAKSLCAAVDQDFGMAPGMIVGPYRSNFQTSPHWPSLLRKLGVGGPSNRTGIRCAITLGDRGVPVRCHLSRSFYQLGTPENSS